jgi:hypothetical protein
MIEILNWFAVSSTRVLTLFVFMWLLSACLSEIIKAGRN